MALLDFHKTEISALNALIQLIGSGGGIGATAANQLLEIDLLGDIDSKLGNPLQVDITSTVLPPDAATENTLQGVSTGISSLLEGVDYNQAYSYLRETALSNSPTEVKAGQGNLYGLNIINTNATPIYIKFYNSTVVGTTVGTSIPVDIYLVPATGSLIVQANITALHYFNSAITVACTTGVADNDNTAPATPVYVNITYK